MNLKDLFALIPDKWLFWIEILGKIIIAFVVTKIILNVGSRLIDNFFKSYQKSKFNTPDRKVKTMDTLLKNIFKYLMYFVLLTIVLSFFHVDIKSLLTLAGIGGLAVGFGAQSLVRDVITGFFILFEDQFGVGDNVTIDKYNGIVEEVGLRITKLRDFSGDLHIIPNGQITVVTNHSNGNKRALLDIYVAYEEDITKVLEVLKGICEKAKEDLNDIVEGPEVLGVTELGSSGVKIQIIAKTKPMTQWGVERELRLRIKNKFDEMGIEIPYNKLVIYQKSS